LKKEIFDFEIPDELLFSIPKDEVDIITADIVTTIVFRDRLFKKHKVTVKGVNEAPELLSLRARGHLYQLRERMGDV
jgi:hypothetical protein